MAENLWTNGSGDGLRSLPNPCEPRERPKKGDFRGQVLPPGPLLLFS